MPCQAHIHLMTQQVHVNRSLVEEVYLVKLQLLRKVEIFHINYALDSSLTLTLPSEVLECKRL